MGIFPDPASVVLGLQVGDGDLLLPISPNKEVTSAFLHLSGDKHDQHRYGKFHPTSHYGDKGKRSKPEGLFPL